MVAAFLQGGVPVSGIQTASHGALRWEAAKLRVDTAELQLQQAH